MRYECKICGCDIHERKIYTDFFRCENCNDDFDICNAHIHRERSKREDFDNAKHKEVTQ